LLLLTSAARRLFGALDYRALVARLEEAVRELIGATAIVYKVLPDGRTIGGDTLAARAARTRGHVTDESRFRAAVAAGTADRVSHVLEVRAPSGRTLRSGDLFIMDLLAEYFGVAVRNASLVRELEERRSAILELNQIKTDLIAMLAHDFKSPLTSIVGFTELAMDLGEINPDQREYLESVKRLALRLADLASDTLAFSRLERNEIDLLLGEVDLGEMARETADLFADQREVNVSLTGDPVVRGDLNRLRQVLYNLVENAIKYSADGKPVDVAVTGGDERVRVQVVDRGIGIPGEELSSVFGRFSRASNARKLLICGTGFGLYLARQIVELHGGSISVESAEGEGSTFTVDLPRRGAAWHEAPLSVAVLETERESRSFIAHALREAGLRVHIYHSVEDFIRGLEMDRVDRLVIDYDDIVLSGEQTAALETAQDHYGFAIVPVEKPFLVQDLLGAIRSRPE
jgi:signal transduction histidine kinase